MIEVRGKKIRGRMYPWGVVEIENMEHNDFVRLKTMLVAHMQDLQEVTHETHYENYRSEKLGSQYKRFVLSIITRDDLINHMQFFRRETREVNNSADIMVQLDKDRMLREKEEELKKMQEMIAKMQADMQAQKNAIVN